jgi:methionyl aminopeptidase
MTEKQYGGATGRGSGKVVIDNHKPRGFVSKSKKNNEIETNELANEAIEGLKKAGQIAKQAREFIRKIIKPGMKLLDIAEQIEGKITELGGKLAFPVNLSINEIAAHYTPSHDDETLASGLLKVDLGVHVDGYIADTAFSLDLEDNEENKKLIEAADKALEKAIKTIKFGVPINEIGKEISEVIVFNGFSPIRNLTGHQVSQWYLHSGFTVPNYDNGNTTRVEEGSYAIEPFTTTGQGLVYESKPSGIFIFQGRTGVRDRLAKEIMNFIETEYKTLPFCSRWLVKKFGSRAIQALAMLKQTGAINEFSQLLEKGKGKVAQAEHTVIVSKDKVEVTTA